MNIQQRPHAQPRLRRSPLTAARCLALLICLITLAPQAGAQILSTRAGTGTTGYTGDGGPATSATLEKPFDVAVDSDGHVYIADRKNKVVRKIDAITGDISTFAGGVTNGIGDSALATQSRVRKPSSVAFDSSGNGYIADTEHHRIRRVDAGTGIITTIAGTGTKGYAGDGGVATDALLKKPYGIAVDSQGNVIFSDSENHRLRQISPSGTITTIAGTGSGGYNGDGIAATSAQLKKPHGIFIDEYDNIFIADTENHRIRKISGITGLITTVAGDGSGGYSGDGGAATSARINKPTDVFAVTEADTPRVLMVVVDATSLDTQEQDRKTLLESWGHTVTLLTASSAQSAYDTAVAGVEVVYVAREVSSGDVSTKLTNAAVGVVCEEIALNDELGFSSTYQSPSDDEIEIVDITHDITSTFSLGMLTIFSTSTPVQVLDGTLAGGLQTLAETDYSSTNRASLAVIEVGDAVYSSGTAAGRRVMLPWGRAGMTFSDLTADGKTILRRSIEWAAKADPSLGTTELYIADSENHVIRKVAALTETISTIAGNGSAGYAGDGAAATGARLKKPKGVAVDSSGDIFIADTENHRIRKVTVSTGVISTFAGTGDGDLEGDGGPASAAKVKKPRGVRFNNSGELLISDSDNHAVRLVDSGNIISIYAGPTDPIGDNGLATGATLLEFEGVTLAPDNSLYIASTQQNLIRRVDLTTNIITTVMGYGLTPDPVTPGDDVELDNPCAVAVHANGDIYVADREAHRIVKYDAATAVYSVYAGITGSGGYNGDNIAATSAKLDKPTGVALDSSGNLYIADRENHRIRKVNATTGLIETVAGDGNSGYTGDGSAATLARLDKPEDVHIYISGQIFITDSNNDAIRVIETDGTIETVAGGNGSGFSGDGGAPDLAELSDPRGIGMSENSRRIYIADTNNHRVRDIRYPRVVRWAEVESR